MKFKIFKKKSLHIILVLLRVCFLIPYTSIITSHRTSYKHCSQKMSTYTKPQRSISVDELVLEFKHSGEFDKLKNNILSSSSNDVINTNVEESLVSCIRDYVKKTVNTEVLKNNTLISNRNRNQPSVIANIENEIARTYGENIQKLLKKSIVDNEELKAKIKDSIIQSNK